MTKANWKSIIGWTVAALILVGIIGTNIYQMQDEKSDKPIVKIGVTLPLTGAMAKMGQDAKRALEIRFAEIPQESKYQYKLIFEDDQLQSAKEFTNAQKLINFNNVDIMMSGFSGGATAIGKLANEKKVVYWHLQWTEEPSKESPFVFTYNQMPKDVAKTWLDVAYQKGFRQIAIINNETHAGGEYIISSIKELLPNYPDMQIVDIERVPLFGSDLRTTLLKMNSKNPDIYLAVLLTPTLDEFAKKMKEQSITTQISSINSFDHAKEKNLFNGNWAVGVKDYNGTLFDKYKQMYKEDLDPSLAPYFYDIFGLIIQSYEKSDYKLTGEELSNNLLKQKIFNAGFGPAQMDVNGVLHIPVVTGVMQNGQFVEREN